MSLDIDEIIEQAERESHSRWCPVCEMTTTFSPQTPYGTCQCS
jgi:hypothetical protein